MENTIHEHDVTVSFTGAVQLELKTTLSKALEAARFLAKKEVENGLSAYPQFNDSIVETNTKITSPLEALRSSNSKTFPQRIAALGYYISHKNESENFDPAEVL